MQTFHLDELDSTNEHAKRLAMRYPGQSLLVTANRQTAGRGRSGRLWQSPVGGAWFTLVWPIEKPIEHASVIPLLVGWAVLQSVRKVIGATHTLKIKWPNDVLLGDEQLKVAGVLCEQVLPTDHGGAGGGLVVGVGINVNFDQAQLDDDLRCAATTLLSATGRAIELSDLIELCVQHIVAALDGPDRDGLTATTLQQVKTHLAWMNESVCVRSGHRLVKGICHSLDPSGRIQIMVGQQLRLFNAGEVSQLRISSDRTHLPVNAVSSL